MALAATAGDSNALPAQLVAEGRKTAARLHDLLIGCLQLTAGSPTLYGPVGLAEQILFCFDRTLAKLHGVAGTEDDFAGSGRKRKPERGSAGAPSATSSKRIRTSSAGGNGARVETKSTTDDEFLWRKYGQKEIKNRKHPRFYYRCSYKDDHGCTATKQVQQSEDDTTSPAVYVITYFGEHTCRPGTDAAAVVVDGGEDQSQEQFVISFGSSSGGASVSWPCSGDDAQINSETSQESSLPEAGEEEQLRPCTANVCDELLIEESTPPESELLGLISSPDLKPQLDGWLGLLDLELGESSFGINIDGFINNLDVLSVYSMDNAW
ncbi:hypothetical protein E2562_036236 [Oryza meyeriana var. granulata]|uniref:WRKY domain-containing protein n=1 Tax=Oryza meyeriana var. granulata TaxID=110450 RepID=A0A6G1ET50_9ORYZ|nr:hypothetical protein E2562_036236 [Oryza meyeriana var. granulata]